MEKCLLRLEVDDGCKTDLQKQCEAIDPTYHSQLRLPGGFPVMKTGRVKLIPALTL
jgi:hypothetical protein